MNIKHTPTTALAVELIQRPSVTPDDAGCQAVIASRLEALGFEIALLDSADVSNLWARRGESGPLLVFVGHTDVVPPGNESEWKYPPFAAALADGMVHGRGAADMKSSVAAMVTACERFFSQEDAFSGSVAFLITSDEEGAAIDGTRVALEKLNQDNVQIDYCLVGEPTSEQRLGDVVKIGRRGSLSGELKIFGKQGHVAYPHLADNAIHRSGALIDALSRLEFSDGDELFPDTTCQISNLHAGVGAGNVIPGVVELSLNFRHSPNSQPQNLIDMVESICNRLDLRFESKWEVNAECYRTAETEFTDLVCQAVFDVVNVKAQRSAAGGTSDGRFVAKYGAQVVEFGPLNATIHKVDECLDLEDLQRLSAIYEQVLWRLNEKSNK